MPSVSLLLLRRPQLSTLFPYTTLFRSALLGFVPELTRTYGDAAATVAADWYDEQRALAGAPGRFRAVMAPPLESAIVQQRIRRSEEHTSELQSRGHLVCRLLLEKKKQI